MSEDLTVVRASVNELQARILNRIWTAYFRSEPRVWPTIQEIQLEFGKSETLAAMAALPPGAVASSGRQYSLSLLGLLLSREGGRVEQFLDDFLSFLSKKAKCDYRIRDVTSEDMRAAYDMTDAELDLLGIAVERGIFHDGINELVGAKWSFRVPANLADIVGKDAFRPYIADRAIALATQSAAEHQVTGGAEMSNDDDSGSGRPTTVRAVVRQTDEEIPLEAEQVRTLELLVEASRSVSSEQRRPFMGVRQFADGRDILLLLHPGIGHEQTGVYRGDIEQLAAEDLIRAESEPNRLQVRGDSQGVQVLRAVEGEIGGAGSAR